MNRALAVVWSILGMLAFAPVGATTDYGLTPIEIAPDTYVFEGRREHFNAANGGNIVNIAAIVTDAGVALIDSGPSKRYAEQLRAALARMGAPPIVLVFNTHLHPDHFLGNQVFRDVPIAALPETLQGIQRDGEAFAAGAYRLVGAWMAGTEVTPPNQVLQPGVREIGGHRLHMLALSGHSEADLAIFDATTGVLFTGDLVFYQRAPTTPHAHVPAWLESLDRLEALPFEQVVPGHGPVHRGNAGIVQTRDYLRGLEAHLHAAAERGLDEAETLSLPLPRWARALAVGKAEYRRSVSHLYGERERRSLGPIRAD